MIRLFTTRKRFNKIYDVIKFKASNPQSKLYGHFKVSEHKDVDEENDINLITYDFLTYRIIVDQNKKTKSFYSSGMEQCTLHRFLISFQNDASVVDMIFNDVDKHIFYYTE